MRGPVYPGYFADPFVWQQGDSWYGIGTGVVEATAKAPDASEALTAAGKPGVFLILRSRDFSTWTPLCAALERLEPEFGDTYWAPEIAFAEGRFWLYYSVGRGDKAHHLRVALSERPEGPYRDCGVTLTDPFTCPFAIDASPFQDADGCWYLFYARDFLDSERPGTALVVDRLAQMTRLAGEQQVVARARYDWQRFLAGRIMYGARYDWHTLEGPCVRKRNGRYWCLYSAGHWETGTYGVDYLAADRVLGPWDDTASDRGPRLLHILPGERLGPGHNSIAEGPGGRDYIVYHAWDPAMTARRMFIDPLEWDWRGPRIVT
ncbi:MAG: family 43 glycosylhydrolase [Acidobacteria bacterium]|nr:family 43 glycosylhydrolase [Acidobacteriota bacterium]